MERINELIDLIYNAQDQKDKQEQILNNTKSTISLLESSINQYKEELLSLIENDDPINNNDKIAVRLHRANVGYTNEKDVINWLKNNFEGKLINTKISESLDKNALKKELKTNTLLQEGLKPYILSGQTDYVVVTNSENYSKMLDHMKEGK